MTVTDHAEILAALRAVPGVARADVEPDDSGGLGVLRLDLDPGVDEAEVAAAVGQLLADRFGIGVDPDRVRLVEEAATPALTPTPAPAPANARRAAISRMQIVSSGLEVTAAVTLTYAGTDHRGEATGTATQSGVQRAVAVATLRALESLVGGQVRFELDHVDVTANGGVRAVVVGVTMLSGSGSERLTGAATVHEDVRQACIRATLAAVNRRTEPMLA